MLTKIITRSFTTTRSRFTVYKLSSAQQFTQLAEQEKKIVLVDFTATWCGPCRMLAPILDDIGAGRHLDVLKVDIDEFPEIAQKFNVRSVPTVIAYKHARIANQFTGFQNESDLKRWISEL